MAESSPSLTLPAEPDWPRTPEGYRRWQGSAVLGSGDDVWRRARRGVLRWEVKTRTGLFALGSAEPVRSGDHRVVSAEAFGVRVREPVEVVDVVTARDRVGFSYRALPGHPIRGEEAFIVHRDGDRAVLTVRSLARPAESGAWRVLFPLLLVAQRLVRRRYLRVRFASDRGAHE